MKFEKVYTIHAWYDGPRLGIADFKGKPHIYKSEWDNDLEDWKEYYYLKPIDLVTFNLILDDFEKWKKSLVKIQSSNSRISGYKSIEYKMDNNIESIFEFDYMKAHKAKPSFEYEKTGSTNVSWEVIS